MINPDRLIKLTQKLIRINSENPPGRELECARFIEKDMRSCGLDVKTYTFEKGRPNIVATLKGSWPRKKAAQEAILITPHFDTVPLGKGWTQDPLGGKIIGSKIYGRGTSDDKGNAAVCMEVIRSMKEDRRPLKRDLIMGATVDEETGSHAGIIPLLARRLLKPASACIVDSDEYDTIIAQKGLFHSRVRIYGKKAHGAYNWRGVNAIEAAARVIAKLKKLKFRYRKHKYLHGPTVNIGTIQGGDKVNMVADFCEFSLDTRFAVGMKSQDVIRAVKKVIASEADKFELIIDDLQQPYEIDPRHPLVKTYVDSARRMGIRATLKGSEGATVISFFKKYGIPAFATGFGSHGTAHTNDEFADVRILKKGARLLEQYLRDYDEAG